MNCYQIFQELLDTNRISPNLRKRYNQYTYYIKDLRNLKIESLKIHLVELLMKEYICLGESFEEQIYNNCVKTKYKEFIKYGHTKIRQGF